MPPLIRRYVKTSFVFLIAGLLLGGYVMGVATWMFPRPARDDPRYRPELATATYWIMTLSTAARAIAEVLASYAELPGLRAVVAAGGIGRLAGALLFVVNMWWRVRMPAVSPPARRVSVGGSAETACGRGSRGDRR